MNFKSWRVFCTWLVGGLLLIAPAAWSQATTGSILGLVMDSSGAVVVGAHVTAANAQSGIAYDGVTGPTGTYHILNIVPGDYIVSAAAAGFQKTQMPPVTLVIDQKLVLNLKLLPGAATETVVVNDLPPVLQTQSSETGTVISAQDITDLPLAGRNFYSLTLLVPAVRSQLLVLRTLACQYSPARLRVSVALPAGPRSSALDNALTDLDAVCPGVLHFEPASAPAASGSARLFAADGSVLRSWTGFRNAAELSGILRTLLGAPDFLPLEQTPHSGDAQ